jgi:DDE family transposase
MNWRGRPLTGHETILHLIGATTTKTGLRVTATLDTGIYPTGRLIHKHYGGSSYVSLEVSPSEVGSQLFHNP